MGMASPVSGVAAHHPSDERLTELARAGDPEAFAAIVQRYQTELLAHARRLVLDGRADDVVQQAFLNAWSALTAGSEVSHLRGWLHTIVRNAASRTQRPIEAPLPDEAVGAESLEELVQRRATVRAALSELNALPTRQREALVSTALHGIPRARVASRMGLSEGAVRQLVHRARSTLRQAVTAVLPYPLIRALGRGASDATGPASDAVVGASAGSAGALIVKLGAVVAAGALATGVSVHEISRGSDHHRSAVHRRTSEAARPSAHAPARRPLAGDRSTGRRDSPAPGTRLRLVADGDRDSGAPTGHGDGRDRVRTRGRHGERRGDGGDRGGDVGDGATGSGASGPREHGPPEQNGAPPGGSGSGSSGGSGSPSSGSSGSPSSGSSGSPGSSGSSG
jgi:RNA polymerase sigma factor (sigma-70 family)